MITRKLISLYQRNHLWKKPPVMTEGWPHIAKDSSVYLDYNATTPLDPEVIAVVTGALNNAWGNPSSFHHTGMKAKSLIATARENVAAMIGSKSSDIIFTSGGTEGNNWILRMAVEYFQKYKQEINLTDKSRGEGSSLLPHFITTNIEHDSIQLVLEKFQQNKIADVTFVPVRHSSCAVHVDDVISAVRPTTIMVTVMTANNETGVIQPIAEIAQAVKSLQRMPGETQRILLHTDAAQALGKISVDVEDLGVDFLTIVGHKFYGPRIGAIYVKDPEVNVPIYPLLYGGGQERNFRPGTENTPMIAGLGKAAELVNENLDKYRLHMEEIRDYLEEKLTTELSHKVVFNGKCLSSKRLPNTCNVSFIGGSLAGHEILSSSPCIQASVGAACHAQDRPSHILLAAGVEKSAAWKALRISVGRETSKDDIDAVVGHLQSLFKNT